MKLNKKGFTLIELLAVLVILTAILLVALPGVASTFERNKQRINEQKIEVIKSAGEIYASRYKKDIEYDEFLKGDCGISIQMLLDKDLITDDELKDSDGNDLYSDYSTTMVIYNTDGTYEIDKDGTYNCLR